MGKESTTTLTIDIPNKAFALTGSVLAVGTTANVVLKGYGTAAATDLQLAIVYKGVEMASCTTFTDSGQ